MTQDIKLELKYQSVLERIAKITARYEDEIAGIRAEATLISQESEQLKQQLLEERATDVSEEADPVGPTEG